MSDLQSALNPKYPKIQMHTHCTILLNGDINQSKHKAKIRARAIMIVK